MNIDMLEQAQEQQVRLVKRACEQGRKEKQEREAGPVSEEARVHAENVRAHGEQAVVDLVRPYVSTSGTASSTESVTRFLMLPDVTIETCASFLAAYTDDPDEAVAAKMDRCRSLAVRKSTFSSPGVLWFVLGAALTALLTILGAAAFPKAVVFPFAAPFAFLVVYLLLAKKLGVRRVMKQSLTDRQRLDAICDIYGSSGFRAVSLKALAVLVLLTVAGLGFSLYQSFPSLDRQIVSEIRATGYSGYEARMDEVLLSGGQVREDAADAVVKAVDNLGKGSVNAVKLALYAGEKVSAGFPAETADRLLCEQAENVNYGAYESASERTLLGRLMEAYPGDPARVVERYRNTASSSDKDLAVVVGAVARNRSLSDRTGLARELSDAGFPGMAFLGGALTEEDLPAVTELLISEEDPAQQAFLGEVFAIRCDSLEAAVPVLYALKEKGRSLAAVFPDGITVSCNLAPLNYAHWDDEYEYAYPQLYRYITLSRREKDMEMKGTSSSVDHGSSTHDKEDPSSYTVRLETGWMDRIPLEHLPATLEDCDRLIVADMTLEQDGSVYVTTQRSKGSYSFSSGSSTTYYPTYARVYRVWFVEREGTIPEFACCAQVSETGAFPETKGLTDTLMQMKIRSHYLAPDLTSWADESMDRVLGELAECDWNIITYYLKYYNSDQQAE